MWRPTDLEHDSKVHFTRSVLALSRDRRARSQIRPRRGGRTARGTAIDHRWGTGTCCKALHSPLFDSGAPAVRAALDRLAIV